MEEGLRWFSTLGVGGILAGMMFFVTRAQQKNDAEARERLSTDYSKALVSMNERLEHLVNTARMERQASQSALLDTLQDISGVIAAHTTTIHDLRDWLRKN